MNRSRANPDRLFAELLEGELSAIEREQLQEQLRTDAALRRLYRKYMTLDALLRWEIAPPLMKVGEEGSGARSQGPEVKDSLLAIPTLSTTHYPLPTTFVGGPVFPYMVATVVLSLMLLGAWAYKISHVSSVLRETVHNQREKIPPAPLYVGRITGMKDCQWSNPDTQTVVGASASLDREYALASGLLEITYKTGAKVILEGPCKYKVDSDAGGYLARGKLTANIRGQKSEARNQKSPNPHSPIPNPFVVRTPTAVVTDLGTEFGVEVGENGDTTSFVFKGSVRIQITGVADAASGDRQQAMILRENESVRIENKDGKPSITSRAAVENLRFVREMPAPRSIRDREAYAELVLSLEPAVYYRMERPKDGARVVFDSASGGRHGELRLGNEFGGSSYLSGRFGDSLNFRGPDVGDHIIVPDYPKAADGRLTVSAWVMATARPTWAMIAANWGHPQDGTHLTGQFLLGLCGRDGDLMVRVTQPDGQHVEAREGANHPFPLFAWQHVTLVADGTVLRLYRNGKQVASASYSGILPSPPMSSLGIGCKTDNTGRKAVSDLVGNVNSWLRSFFWKGRIDELAVFNRALSPAEIRALYLGNSAAAVQTKGGNAN